MQRVAFYAALGLAMAVSWAGAAEIAKGFINAADYPSLQEAIDAVPREGGTVLIPAGDYVITKTLDLSRRYGLGAVAGRGAVTLQGAGITATRLLGRTGSAPVIDLSASGYCHVKDMYISGQECDVGVLLCRGTGEKEGSAGAIVFDSVLMGGNFRKAAFYNMSGEVCRFYNSFFETNSPNSFAFYFGPENLLNVPSPSVTIFPSSNTELRFIGCTFGSFGENSVGLYVRGGASDVSVWGCYFANRGQAAIYLDGSRACVDSINMTDVRIEGEHGRHCLYARGCVRRVSIIGGTWLSTGGEAIRYEAPPDGSTWAENWLIQQTSLDLYDWAFPDPNLPGFYARQFPQGEDGYVLARFDDLRNSILDLTWGVVAHFEKDEQGKEKVRYIGNRRILVIDRCSHANRITVRDKGDVTLKGKVVDTTIIPLGGQGEIQFAR